MFLSIVIEKGNPKIYVNKGGDHTTTGNSLIGTTTSQLLLPELITWFQKSLKNVFEVYSLLYAQIQMVTKQVHLVVRGTCYTILNYLKF